MASKVMYLGQVLTRETLKPKVLNVRVIKQVYDAHLHMYFPEPQDFKVLETDKVQVDRGDIIRFQLMNERHSVEVNHEAVEVVFPIGRTVDPVTGRRCKGKLFIDEEARQEEAQRIASLKNWGNYSL